MSSSQVYPTPLSGRSIRLLRIDPGASDSIPKCSLVSASLDDDSLQYFALSYVWGSSADRENIVCNGYVIEVTSNLYAFLLEYRRRVMNGGEEDAAMVVWVDALW
jgi:hypothetical protein